MGGGEEDEASLDLVRYLGHYWQSHGSRVLLLSIVRCEGLALGLTFTARLLDLRRDLPITQITLQPLNQEESLQLVEAIVEMEQRESGSGGQTTPASKTPVVALSHFLFAQTRTAIIPARDAQAIARERTADLTNGYKWHLAAGADP